jgi:hypothetical protein
MSWICYRLNHLSLRNLSKYKFCSLNIFPNRTKVDLTKFIEEHHFTFDNVFDSDKDNQQIYQDCVLPLVVEAFKGAKTTCFAYG